MPVFDLKEKKNEEMAVKEERHWYPNLYLDNRDFELDIGNPVVLKGVVTEKTETKRQGSKKNSYRISVKKLTGSYSKEEYMKLSDEEKDEYDEKQIKDKG